MAETATPPKAEEAPSYAEYFAETPVASILGQTALRFMAHVDGEYHVLRLPTGDEPHEVAPFLDDDYYHLFAMCDQREGMSVEAAYFEAMIRLMLQAMLAGWRPTHVRFMAHHDLDGEAMGRCFLAGPKPELAARMAVPKAGRTG